MNPSVELGLVDLRDGSVMPLTLRERRVLKMLLRFGDDSPEKLPLPDGDERITPKNVRACCRALQDFALDRPVRDAPELDRWRRNNGGVLRGTHRRRSSSDSAPSAADDPWDEEATRRLAERAAR